MTPKWEDTEEIAAAAPSWDDTEEISSDPTPAALPELSQAEAGAVSFGQGSGLGLTPIVSGIVGAGTNAVEQAGDALGLSQDAELESKGFSMPDKKKGLEGLMDAYYSARDNQKKYQEAAHEQYPVQSVVANIAGSIPSTLATAGATGVASKILPSTKAIAPGFMGTVATGAREGLKAGALNGLGEGDAKLLEGDVAGTANEVGSNAVGGSIVGGAIPAATGTVGGFLKGVGNLATNNPLVQQLKTSFKGGQAGMDLTEKSAGEGIKTFSEDLLNKIRSRFSEAGMKKASALEYADEIGLRVNAGEKFDDVMDEMIQRGASSVEDQADKLKLMNTFNQLKNGPADKVADKLDVNRAKNIQKMGAKGMDLLDEQVENGNVQDFVPGSDSDKKLALATQKFQKLGDDRAEGKMITKLVQQAGDTLPIDIKKYDLDNLSLRDLEEVLSEVNRYTGDLSGPASKATNSEKIARGLAAELRNLSEEALDGAGQKSGNNQLSKTFSALNRAGIKDNVLTNSQLRKDQMVDNLRNTVTAGNSINRERMFQYLKEVDPKFSGLEDHANLLNDFNDIAKQVKPLQSGSLDKTLLGSAKNYLNQGANAVGKSPVTKTVLAPFEASKKIFDSSKEQLASMAQRPEMKAFLGPLNNAAQSDAKKRTAILYGLYQQPAFRELYQSLGEDITPQLDETAGKAGNQARDLLLNNDEEN